MLKGLYVTEMCCSRLQKHTGTGKKNTISLFHSSVKAFFCATCLLTLLSIKEKREMPAGLSPVPPVLPDNIRQNQHRRPGCFFFPFFIQELCFVYSSCSHQKIALSCSVWYHCIYPCSSVFSSSR